MEEKRRYRRFITSFRLVISPKDSCKPVVEGELLDLSFFGLKAKVTQQLPMGEQVVIEVQDPTSEKLMLRLGEGEILHQQASDQAEDPEHELGVRFVNSDDRKIQWLLDTAKKMDKELQNYQHPHKK